ncbi:hypothetical protein ACJQWK_03185 [Exserohilum turcicum]|uniref:Cytochrome P450 n=1 Tax=Exserohilum turcicum (strain 28A) TaxID=671987 RepID=R0J4H0_EXST2|nr:uncharacterized protein SETTUDRAFT_18499 [Exserohilum turcica Et28A]EOA91840.1 hypothetical protein SETTUDRAFT_18499 [Exserohilum turcica Et28A]
MKLVRETAEDIVTSHERSCCGSKDQKVSKDEDMLSLLMKSSHFSHKDLVEQTVHFFAAGTETVAATACWAIHLLSRHVDVQTRLRDEIRKNIASPYSASEDSVSSLQFHNLEYLNAVVQEILRFHSINTLLWRECIEPATIAGVSIPKGTAVVFSPWVLNRDPVYWGPESRSFSPERWLNSSNGGASNTYSFLTFGGGPRRCVGEQYARDELLCLVAGLIGRYEFTPLDPESGSDDGKEIGDDFALTLFKILENWELNFQKVPGW